VAPIVELAPAPLDIALHTELPAPRPAAPRRQPGEWEVDRVLGKIRQAKAQEQATLTRLAPTQPTVRGDEPLLTDLRSITGNLADMAEARIKQARAAVVAQQETVRRAKPLIGFGTCGAHTLARNELARLTRDLTELERANKLRERDDDRTHARAVLKRNEGQRLSGLRSPMSTDPGPR